RAILLFPGRMKRLTYVTLNEQSWRALIRQPIQPDLLNFFGNLMNEYKKVINDIDELCLKFYEVYERMHMYPDSDKNENEDTVMH
ncbi:8588_t:CDS:2, partial [Funneliformis caledonium]